LATISLLAGTCYYYKGQNTANIVNLILAEDPLV